jgi:copper(I)-binding protein
MKMIVLVLVCLFVLPETGRASPEGLSFHTAWTVPYGPTEKAEYHIYGIMSNLTPQNDVLLRAETSLGKTVVFQSLIFAPQKNQNPLLTTVETLDIPAEQVIFYDPGRTRLTVKQPLKILKVGDTFPLTLTFRRAGIIKTTVEVKRCCEDRPASAQKDGDR